MLIVPDTARENYALTGPSFRIGNSLRALVSAHRSLYGTKLWNVFLEFFNDTRWRYYTVILNCGGHMRSELSACVSVIGIPTAGNDSGGNINKHTCSLCGLAAKLKS